MKHSLNHSRSPLSLAVSSAIVALSLTACGGGSDDDVVAVNPPTPVVGGTPLTPVDPGNPNQVVLSGLVVLNSTVSGATVCIDLNTNNACDAGEPGATPTALDGRYTVVYDSTQIATATVNASRLIAVVDVVVPRSCCAPPLNQQPGTGRAVEVLRCQPSSMALLRTAPLSALVASRA